LKVKRPSTFDFAFLLSTFHFSLSIF